MFDVGDRIIGLELPDTFYKLAELLEQDQFELLIPEKMRTESGRISDKASASMDIPLVYLMNDAVESFLVFRNVRMTGEYHSDYQGELQASMTRQDGRFVLVIKQDDTVLTLFFEDLELEVHLYEYAYTGHFWVKDYEYLSIALRFSGINMIILVRHIARKKK